MYTKVVFESAEGFFRACRQHRAEGDTSPFVPSTVYVVFDGREYVSLSGEGAKQFDLGDITQDDMVKAAFCAASSKVHLT